MIVHIGEAQNLMKVDFTAEYGLSETMATKVDIYGYENFYWKLLLENNQLLKFILVT